MAYTSFEDLIKDAKTLKKTTVAIAAGEDLHTLQAVKKAYDMGIIDFYITGNKDEILNKSAQIDFNITEDKIINASDNKIAAFKAVELIREHKADFLMKGKLQTSELLRDVVNKETGISTGKTMSHVGLFSLPNYHKLICLTDGAMIPNPNLEKKKNITINAVQFMHSIGIIKPKVGIITAIEYINPKMKETLDADELKQMSLKGEFGNCIVEGPISYDIAMYKEVAEIKGYNSPVAGDVDILVMHDMICGNVLGKAFTHTCGGVMAGCVVGANVPIVLTSRGASSEEKYLSILLAAVSATRK